MPLFNIKFMNIEFVSLVTIHDQYISIAAALGAALPYIIQGASALGSSGISAVSAKRRNAQEKKQREKEIQENVFLNRMLRQKEDADKVKSLKNAGLNPNLAYGGATPVSAPMNPTTVEEEFDGVADTIKESGSATASMLQQQPVLNADVANKHSATKVNNATAEKVKAEAEKLELENADKKGENQASFDKLKSIGVDTSNINVNGATGYLRGLDFADEYHTKGFERKLRGLSAQLDAYFKQIINTDENFKSRWINGQMAVYDNMLTTQQGNELSNDLRRQDISLFGLKKQMMKSQITKTNVDTSKTIAEISKVHVDIEQVRANTQIAKENSYLTVFKNCADALRNGDGENFAYWNTIGAIKSGQFDNWQKTLLLGNFLNGSNGSVYSVFGEISNAVNKEMRLYNPYRGKKANENYSMPHYDMTGHGQINGYVKAYGHYPFEPNHRRY